MQKCVKYSSLRNIGAKHKKKCKLPNHLSISQNAKNLQSIKKDANLAVFTTADTWLDDEYLKKKLKSSGIMVIKRKEENSSSSLAERKWMLKQEEECLIRYKRHHKLW